MGIHQPHSHNVLPRWQQSVREHAARLHVKLQHAAGNICHAINMRIAPARAGLLADRAVKVA